MDGFDFDLPIGDEDDERDEPRERISVKDITEEMKAEYVELVRSGFDVGAAARKLGSTGQQFRKLRNGGYWHDQAFADQVTTALADPVRAANQIERIDELVWGAAEKGSWKAIEKLAYAYHPDFEKLRHSNLRISGEIHHAVRALFPDLNDEQVEQRIIEVREAKRLRALPPVGETGQ